jgi:hypothetical protein
MGFSGTRSFRRIGKRLPGVKKILAEQKILEQEIAGVVLARG